MAVLIIARQAGQVVLMIPTAHLARDSFSHQCGAVDPSCATLQPSLYAGLTTGAAVLPLYKVRVPYCPPIRISRYR